MQKIEWVCDICGAVIEAGARDGGLTARANAIEVYPSQVDKQACFLHVCDSCRKTVTVAKVYEVAAENHFRDNNGKRR